MHVTHGSVAILVCGVAVAVVRAQFDDPQAGIWRLNRAKSTFAGTAPTEIALRVTPNEFWRRNGKVIRADPGESGVDKAFDTQVGRRATEYIEQGKSPDGTKWRCEYTTAYDASETPVAGQCPFGEAVAVIRRDARTTESAFRHKGKRIVTAIAVVSPDQKVRTVSLSGTDLLGQVLDGTVYVYAKR